MRLREERRKMEDGGRGNRVQWLNQCVFQGNMIIFQLDSLCYLSGNLLFLCQVITEQILHGSITFQAEAGNVFYSIYCLLKVRVFTQFMKQKKAQLNRSRHTHTSSIRLCVPLTFR